MKTSPAEGQRRLQKNTDYIVFFCACSPQTDIFFWEEGRGGGSNHKPTKAANPSLDLVCHGGAQKGGGPRRGEGVKFPPFWCSSVLVCRCSGVLVFWWCFGVVLVVFSWCFGGVFVVFWCCFGGVFVVFWCYGVGDVFTKHTTLCPF